MNERPGTDPTVVIADDESDIRGLVEVAVTRAGATVVASVGDGGAALLAARDLRPDLVILDVAMPILTGLDVCRALRADPETAAIRIMLVSASVHLAANQTAAEQGADAYVHKPFSVKVLSAKISTLLSREVRNR